MKKMFLRAAVISLSVCMTLISCGDDDDAVAGIGRISLENNDETIEFQGAKRVFGDNLVKKVTRSVYMFTYIDTYTYDDNGFVTKVDAAVIYGTTSRSTTEFDYSAGTSIKITKHNNGSTDYATVNIGSNGYACSYISERDGSTYEKSEFTYNEDDLIESITTYNYKDDKIYKYTLEYTDGDLIKSSREEDGKVIHSYTYSYETETLNKINNVDSNAGILIKETGYQDLILAGLLGKSTKHLPIAYGYDDYSTYIEYQYNKMGKIIKTTYGRPSALSYETSYAYEW